MSFDIVDRAMEVEQLYDGVNWILSMQVKCEVNWLQIFNKFKSNI